MKAVRPHSHEFTANAIWNEHGLAPFFAADRQVKAGDGSLKSEFTTDGERWKTTLYYQESGFCVPESGETPSGTEISLDQIREYRIAVERHPDEDHVGEQGFNAHISPRWKGMEVEKKDGTKKTYSVPDGLGDAINVKISGSNVEFSRYLKLLSDAAESVGINGWYFAERDLHEYSNILDAAREVRLFKDRTGPVHARDGPIASMGHLLENDRIGFRSLTQNDSDNNGNQLAGFYHTATLGPERVTELFPDHTFPREVKHYYAREAYHKAPSHPLAHPKVCISYQNSKWNQKVGWDDLTELQTQLDETLHSVLAEAGIPIRSGNTGDGDGGTGPYKPDSYFPAVDHEVPEDHLYGLDLTQIRHDQQSVVIRHLADGMSPVEWESLTTLVTDGGKVSPKDIADEHGRHEDSVRRALNRIEDVVEREYGSVALRSPFIADMVHDAVKEAKDATRRAVEIGAKAINGAKRGLDEHTSAFIAWAAKHDIDVNDTRDARMTLRMGGVDRVKKAVEQGYKLWTDAGRDPARFRSANLDLGEKGTGVAWHWIG